MGRKMIYLDDAIEEVELAFKSVGAEKAEKWILENLNNLPSAQPELIEKEAYIRGFEQGRTKGMIDAQEGKK